MKTRCTLAVSATLVLLIVATTSVLSGRAQAPAQGAGRGQPATPPPPQTGHPSGKLVIWGDVALFDRPDAPDNCILTNRFRRGQRIGFRMTAIDGGTGEVENTATLVAHVTSGGKTAPRHRRRRGIYVRRPSSGPGSGLCRATHRLAPSATPSRRRTGSGETPRSCPSRRRPRSSSSSSKRATLA